MQIWSLANGKPNTKFLINPTVQTGASFQRRREAAEPFRVNIFRGVQKNAGQFCSFSLCKKSSF